MANSATNNENNLREWKTLSAREQLELREEYGYYLDQFPPTCSMETKVARFRLWLKERAVIYN